MKRPSAIAAITILGHVAVVASSDPLAYFGTVVCIRRQTRTWFVIVRPDGTPVQAFDYGQSGPWNPR
jgi:hypothetical protein